MKVAISQLANIAMRNRELVQSSLKVGCMYCGKIYESKEIVEYTDNQKTCICPYCHVDAIIADKSGYELNEKSLESAHNYWFKKK
jgi:NAD-dependent SIR2 family protein deacetylase